MKTQDRKATRKKPAEKKVRKTRKHLVCHDPAPDLLKDMQLLDPVTGKPRDTGPPRA